MELTIVALVRVCVRMLIVSIWIIIIIMRIITMRIVMIAARIMLRPRRREDDDYGSAMIIMEVMMMTVIMTPMSALLLTIIGVCKTVSILHICKCVHASAAQITSRVCNHHGALSAQASHERYYRERHRLIKLDGHHSDGDKGQSAQIDRMKIWVSRV